MSSAFSQPISLADEGIRKSYESSPGKLLLDKFILIELGEPIADDMLVATKSKFFCYSTIVLKSKFTISAQNSIYEMLRVEIASLFYTRIKEAYTYGQSLTNYILALVGSKLTTSKTWIPSYKIGSLAIGGHFDWNFPGAH